MISLTLEVDRPASGGSSPVTRLGPSSCRSLRPIRTVMRLTGHRKRGREQLQTAKAFETVDASA